jgi:hypothetical protein
VPQADNPSSLLACRQLTNVVPGNSGMSLHNRTTGFGQLGRLQEGVEG